MNIDAEERRISQLHIERSHKATHCEIGEIPNKISTISNPIWFANSIFKAELL